MKPIERFQALLDGKKIRRISWDDKFFIALNASYKICGESEFAYYDIHILCNPNIEWELYEEPKPEIKLTPDMVGRKVLRRNGSVMLITGFDVKGHDPKYPVSCTNHDYKTNGAFDEAHPNSPMDIVEILPEGK